MVLTAAALAWLTHARFWAEHSALGGSPPPPPSSALHCTPPPPQTAAGGAHSRPWRRLCAPHSPHSLPGRGINPSQESVQRAVEARPEHFVRAKAEGMAATEEMLVAVMAHYGLK